MPKPVDLSVLGLRPHNDRTRTRSLSMRVTIALSPVLLSSAVRVALPTEGDTRDAATRSRPIPVGP
jgi:hypothetical protein